jgi:hypothetical protein
VIRSGSYHLYQGIGPFFGNLAFGIVVGYPLALAWLPGLIEGHLTGGRSAKARRTSPSH